MRCYVNTFDFGNGSNCSFDKALRTFLGSFRLPGEAQCIDRLMEAFATKLFLDLGVGNPFASGDAAFILAFSTIMLNTDLHNPQIPQSKRMTKEQFIRNNKGINYGSDLPREYLDNLFEDIKNDQIKMNIDINDSDGTALAFTDSNLWNNMIRKSTLDQVPAAFTPTVSARLNAMTRKYEGTYETGGAPYAPGPGVHEKDMFIAISGPVLDAILTVWQLTSDDQTIRRITEYLWTYASVCIGFNLKNILNNLVTLLASRVLLILMKSRNSPTHIDTTNEVYKARIINLTSLLNLDFHTLIASSVRDTDYNLNTDGSWNQGSKVPHTGNPMLLRYKSTIDKIFRDCLINQLLVYRRFHRQHFQHAHPTQHTQHTHRQCGRHQDELEGDPPVEGGGHGARCVPHRDSVCQRAIGGCLGSAHSAVGERVISYMSAFCCLSVCLSVCLSATCLSSVCRSACLLPICLLSVCLSVSFESCV